MMQKMLYNVDYRKRVIFGTLSYVLRLVIGLIVISPILVGFVFSFVPNKMLYKVPSFSDVIHNLTLDNYKWVLDYVPIFQYIWNSFIVCLLIVGVQIVIACLAGFAFAFYEFKGKRLLFNLLLVAMMIPAESTVITNFLNVQDMGLVNTYLGLAITSFVGGTSIFMMRQFFMQLPKSLKEAAVIDGCSEIRFLFRIAAPVALPAIASLAIYLFIGAYNMYFWPMLVAQKAEVQTIQLGIAMLVGTESQEYGYVLAGSMISIIIPVIVFIIGNDYIVKGMTEGAVKG